MSRSLYVFVRSLNPNPYLNSIVYCTTYKDVIQVVFLSIKKNREEILELAQLANNVRNLLYNLTLAKYTYQDIKTKTSHSIDLSSHYDVKTIEFIKSFYNNCFQKIGKELNNNIRLIPYEDLQEQISLIRKTEDVIFDITATTNDIVSDIVAISISEGISSLYTFSSRNQPRFGPDGWISLIHQLEIDNNQDDPNYQYINLLSTKIYRDSIYRIFGSSERIKSIESDKPQIPKEDIDDQLELLKAHRRTLQIYLQQQAKLGAIYTTPGIENGISDNRKIISRIKSTLRGWGVEVEDHPNDDYT